MPGVIVQRQPATREKVARRCGNSNPGVTKLKLGHAKRSRVCRKSLSIWQKGLGLAAEAPPFAADAHGADGDGRADGANARPIAADAGGFAPGARQFAADAGTAGPDAGASAGNGGAVAAKAHRFAAKGGAFAENGRAFGAKPCAFAQRATEKAGLRRGTCTAGGKVAVEAGAVTCGALQRIDGATFGAFPWAWKGLMAANFVWGRDRARK